MKLKNGKLYVSCKPSIINAGEGIPRGALLSAFSGNEKFVSQRLETEVFPAWNVAKSRHLLYLNYHFTYIAKFWEE